MNSGERYYKSERNNSAGEEDEKKMTFNNDSAEEINITNNGINTEETERLK